MTALTFHRLAECEAVIERGRYAFVEVGKALLEIRKKKLYKARDYKSFEAYLSDHWKMSKPYATQMIGAAKVTENIKVVAIATTFPETENQARPLSKLPADLQAEVWQKAVDTAPNGNVTAKHVESVVKDYKREARRKAEPIVELPTAVTLRCGDMRKLSAFLPDESIDLIFTDPPYPEEYLSLWDDLGREATRLLRPGGVLAAYSGQMFLPQIYQMLGQHLDYQWTAGVRHTQGYTRILKNGILNAWKPILLYSKGKTNRLRGLVDITEGSSGDKDAHEWAQPESEAAYYLAHLSQAGENVLDPFMGSGTIPRVAYRMGRQATGFEADEAHFQMARSSFNDKIAA